MSRCSLGDLRIVRFSLAGVTHSLFAAAPTSPFFRNSAVAISSTSSGQVFGRDDDGQG